MDDLLLDLLNYHNDLHLDQSNQNLVYHYYFVMHVMIFQMQDFSGLRLKLILKLKGN
jgi:hypothetical protein